MLGIESSPLGLVISLLRDSLCSCLLAQGVLLCCTQLLELSAMHRHALASDIPPLMAVHVLLHIGILNCLLEEELSTCRLQRLAFLDLRHARLEHPDMKRGPKLPHKWPQAVQQSPDTQRLLCVSLMVSHEGCTCSMALLAQR